jgi:hypothetical protein
LTPGVTTSFNIAGCTGHVQWMTMSLTAGSKVVFDLSATPVSVDLWQPGTTDFTFGGGKAVTECGVNADGFTEGTCQVTRSGLWLVSFREQNSYRATGVGTVAAVVHPAVHQAGQVNGSCLVGSAPRVPYRVTQYAFGSTCPTGHQRELWSIVLFRGDSFVVRASAFESNAIPGFKPRANMDLRGPGLTDFTYDAASQVCSDTYISSGVSEQTSCAITVSGTYVMAGWEGALAITPVVTHAISSVVHRPVSVRHGAVAVITDTLASPAGVPSARCVVQMKGRRWATLSATPARAGLCRIGLRFASKGVRTLRVAVAGAPGWSSRTSATFVLRVT